MPGGSRHPSLQESARGSCAAVGPLFLTSQGLGLWRRLHPGRFLEGGADGGHP